MKDSAREFGDSVLASLAYWQEVTQRIGDQTIEAVDHERHNLFRAVQFGLDLPQAWEMVAAVAVAVMPLVNRRLYRREWVPVLKQLIGKCPEGRQRQKFDLLIQLGRMLRLEQHRDSAMETLHQAEELARQLGDTELLARAYYNIGRLHLDARRYAEAKRASLRALDILNELEAADQALVAWVLNTLGKVSQVEGEYALADQYYSESISIWRTIKNETGLIRSLMDMATNYRYSGQLDKAIEIYNQVQQLLSSTTNELDKSLVGINLGATYYDAGAYFLAEKTFRNAYSLYLRNSGELRLQAILTMNLGNVLLELERLAEAEAFLRQAIDMWEQLDDELNMANSLGTLGEVLAKKGNTDAALALFEEALTLLNKFPTHPFAVQIRQIFENEKKKAEVLLT